MRRYRRIDRLVQWVVVIGVLVAAYHGLCVGIHRDAEAWRLRVGRWRGTYAECGGRTAGRREGERPHHRGHRGHGERPEGSGG